MRIVRAVGAATAAVAILLAFAPAASAADRDCADFATQREAQKYFESKGGPGSDPDRLDGNNNGQACDFLPCPCGSDSLSPAPPPTPTVSKLRARVTGVTDGDTIRVRREGGRRYTVRLIGIDTPETEKVGTPIECGGLEASSYMKRLGFRDRQGRRVTVKTDPTQDRRDRYGRLLAYVTRSDRKNLAEAQIRAGWGKVYVFDKPFKLVDRFRAAQQAAKSAGRGVWSKCGGDFHTPA